MRSMKHEDELFEVDSVEDNCSCPSSSDENEMEDCHHKSSKAGLYTVVDRSKRLKASARERRRRHVLNDALERLRRKVPSVGQRSAKLSKIEVLRMAIDYIAMLSGYLNYATTPPSYIDEQHFLAFNNNNNNNNTAVNHNNFFDPILHEIEAAGRWNQEYENNNTTYTQQVNRFLLRCFFYKTFYPFFVFP